MPAIRQNQCASKLATSGAKPLRWDGIRVKNLEETSETILTISRRASKLSRSTNVAEGARAGESSYTVGTKRASEYPCIELVTGREGFGEGPKSLPVLRIDDEYAPRTRCLGPVGTTS